MVELQYMKSLGIRDSVASVKLQKQHLEGRLYQAY